LLFRRKIMIELRVYCRQLFHFGVPRIVVSVQLESWAEALLRKQEEILKDPSCPQAAEPSGDIMAKVEAILRNASRSTV
jgi:hypothetical protein